MNLNQITILAELQIRMEDDVATIEEQLKEAKARLRQVSENDLPEAMAEAGMREFTLSNGRIVKVEKIYHTSIPEARRAEAFAWLRERGHDSIIKRSIAFLFGRGEDKIAEEVKRRVTKAYPDIDLREKEEVHASTLKAFVRERMEDGEDIPMEAFGIYVRDVAKIAVAR